MEYATIEINLDEETELMMVSNWVAQFTKESQSVYNDSIKSGTDFRIAYYEARRNEEIINALKWHLDNHKEATPKYGTFGDVV